MDNNAVSLFDVTKHHSENVQNAFEYICKNHNIAESSFGRLKEKLRLLFCSFKSRFLKAHRRTSYFESSNSNWLQSEFDLADFSAENVIKATGSAKK